jgi:hypothetical protein
VSAQLPLMPFEPETLKEMDAFLADWLSLEDEEDRIREAKAALRQAYSARIALRALLVAVKRVRAQRALESHAKDPMPRAYQAQYEALVETFLDRRELEKEAVMQDAKAFMRAPVPDMTGGPDARTRA